MSAACSTETVLDAWHWTHDYFSFTTTRGAAFRFDHVQLVMPGLPPTQAGSGARPALRAYSIVCANREEPLECFSIPVPDGAPTSSLCATSIPAIPS